jgi:hypothetical protein
MKRRNPELYRKAKELKERYGVTWDYAFAILRGEREPPHKQPLQAVRSGLVMLLRGLRPLRGGLVSWGSTTQTSSPTASD